ncbi:MAG: tetratricopeptide repeat protein [Chthoniobacterales bacterium]|nr:tetratricopeptide repeat protein [Chthoniobacterales bacterium]MCX7713410.1 tetratricopeptide repeat protein [Chthoniobacterales bacterium]
MKAKKFPTGANLFAIQVLFVSLFIFSLCPLLPLTAQDAVILKDGSRREGTVLGLADNVVRLETDVAGRGKIQATVPVAEVKEIRMEVPAALEKATELRKAGKNAEAVAVLEPVVKQFIGLPVEWIQRATLMLVDAQIESQKVADAEQILVSYQKAYPDDSSAIGLIRAKVAAGKGNLLGARPLISPVIEAAKATKIPTTSQGVLFGQAYYLMGQINENEKKFANALQDYLFASTIFFTDEPTAAKASVRADKLIKEYNVNVP